MQIIVLDQCNFILLFLLMCKYLHPLIESIVIIIYTALVV